jgi:signal transduction histidine kinase
MEVVLLMINDEFMRRNRFVFSFLVALFASYLIVNQINAQSTKDDDALIDGLLSKKIESITVHHQDSILINESLQKATKYSEARNDSALIYVDKAIVQAEKAGLFSKISVALQKKGHYYEIKEDYRTASSCFINALKIEEKHNNEKRIADLNDELGGIYFFQEIFPRSLGYYQEALVRYQKLNDTIGMAKVLGHIGSLYNSREYCEKRSLEQKQTDNEMALDYNLKSLNLFEKKNHQKGIIHSWLNIGNVYRCMGQPAQALGYVEKALDYYRSKNDIENIARTLYTMGLVYNRLMKYDLALNCLNETKELDLRYNYTDGIQFLYEQIAQTYVNKKDYKNAYDYYLKYMIIRDSVYNNEKSKQIFELETKYQTEKKQGEIENLTLVKRQRTMVIYILIASLLIVSLLSWLYFRNIRNKKIISDQKLEIKEKQLLELEQERQLVAAKSVLQGEEAERARLAGDLHDGLGGLLSGVKLKLSFMKENAIITSENLAHFNHALDLLDTSISEMRRVAHNLMPETLMHYGLRTALNDFIKQVAPEESPLIRFNTFGEDLRFDKELEITVYRVTQELVTNAVKHAQAKLIDIQLFTEKERICVQVIDNGMGFDPEKLEPSKTGKGLKNIQDRVTAFNGQFEILSQPGKGTECTMDFILS